MKEESRKCAERWGKSMEKTKQISLWRRLIFIFIMTSTIPIIILCLLMLYETSTALRQNTDALMQNSVKQLGDNLDIQMEAYQDLLYQLYTGDDMVEWVDRINDDYDKPVTINQLRRYLRGILNSKDYIRSITIITESGTEVTYNCIAATTYANSWIDNFSYSMEELYYTISSDNKTHIYSTEYGTTFASEDYYLLHLGHRIIDYRKLEKENGIVILSLDEKVLQQILESSNKNGNENFLVDDEGRIVSCSDKTRIGQQIFEPEASEEEKLDKYRQFAGELLQVNKEYVSIYTGRNEKMQWEIVSAADQSIFMMEIYSKMRIIAGVCLLLLFVTLFLVWKQGRQLMESVNIVVKAMKSVGAGDLETRVPIPEQMPREIETVALQFNDTLEKLVNAQKKEKEATDRQRKAEIRALEAQINPHFLYNTLDTINWMAIDRDEFDISNAINSLATILRYAITDSNGTVTVRDEVEWLRKYIYLQQFRLKNKFVREIEVQPEVWEVKIHKLLLQPFVENAIIHGFRGEQEQCILEVIFTGETDGLHIAIRDNGSGMEPELVEKVNSGQQIRSEGKSHIGMDNAIMRLNSYSDGKAKIFVKSELGKGTEVNIFWPILSNEK